MVNLGSDSDIKDLYYHVCGWVAAISIVVYFVQWRLSLRVVSGRSSVKSRVVWKFWSIRTVKSFFYGAGFLFFITPFGYGLLDGEHGFTDCMSFTMPCLAGMVVGLALLSKQYPTLKVKERDAAPRQLANSSSVKGESDDGANAASDVLVSSEAEKRDATAEQLEKSLVAKDDSKGDAIFAGVVVESNKAGMSELGYYIASVLIIIFGYINYILAHPSNAIKVFVILAAGWFVLVWLAYIWVDRIRNDTKEDYFGFVLYAILLFLLCSLTHTVIVRWGTLLPPASDYHEAKDCHIEHGSYKKAENHVVFSATFS